MTNAACRNCDGRKCMGCVSREYDHTCENDCPDCCASNVSALNFGNREGRQVTAIDKDPWCCAGDKLRINIDGFDAGYINALRSARTLIRALPKDDALAVLDQLIAEFQPFRARPARTEARGNKNA